MFSLSVGVLKVEVSERKGSPWLDRYGIMVSQLGAATGIAESAAATLLLLRHASAAAAVSAASAARSCCSQCQSCASAIGRVCHCARD